MKRKILLTIFIFTFFALLSFFVVQISANAKTAEERFESSLEKTGQEAGYEPDEIDVEAALLTWKISTVINIVLSFVGVIFLILMIYAGYTWMMAAGNEQQVEKARKVLIASIIGMLIVLSAYAISYMVVSKFGNTALKESGAGVPDYNVY